MNPRIRKAISLMTQNLAQPLELAALAGATGYSKPYFCTRFKAATGTPPAQYYKELRLEEARKLLASAPKSAGSVKNIAEQCGFHDVSHFVRDFEQHYGLSPTRYRAQHQGWEKEE